MFRVETAALAPGMCMYTKSANGPFIDLGRDFDFDHEGRIYIRMEYARTLGRFAGLVDPPDPEEQGELEAALGRIRELEEELAELDGVVEAIDVIESRDFRARKKTGRPKRKTNNDEDLEEAA